MSSARRRRDVFAERYVRAARAMIKKKSVVRFFSRNGNETRTSAKRYRNKTAAAARTYTDLFGGGGGLGFVFRSNRPSPRHGGPITRRRSKLKDHFVFFYLFTSLTVIVFKL